MGERGREERRERVNGKENELTKERMDCRDSWGLGGCFVSEPEAPRPTTSCYRRGGVRELHAVTGLRRQRGRIEILDSPQVKHPFSFVARD